MKNCQFQHLSWFEIINTILIQWFKISELKRFLIRFPSNWETWVELKRTRWNKWFKVKHLGFHEEKTSIRSATQSTRPQQTNPALVSIEFLHFKFFSNRLSELEKTNDFKWFLISQFYLKEQFKTLQKTDQKKPKGRLKRNQERIYQSQ